jgi:hypothetical protein
MRGALIRRAGKALGLALLAATAAAHPARADEGATQGAGGQPGGRADFAGEAVSGDAREVANWVIGSGDSRNLPFVVIDKVNAKVFVFDRTGRLQGAAPALIGLSRGDDSVAGIGQRRLATITPGERTTPAGRFEAALGHDLEQDILWIDYDSSLSLHRVIAGNPRDRRRQRLASPSPMDNRISYGCINVPAEFYDKVVMPAFAGTVGIVYILPETKSIWEVFALPRAPVN